jgi:hypothetical protein
VVVDDRIPFGTQKANIGEESITQQPESAPMIENLWDQCLLPQSKQKAELWPIILSKALIKAHNL